MHRIQSLTAAFAVAAAVATASTATAQPPQAPVRDMAAKSGPLTDADRTFVQKAAASGRMEVEHGKMAAAKASNAQVKGFGHTLVKDHTVANEQLMAMARRKNITIAAQARVVNNQASPAGGSATTTTDDTKSGARRTATSGTTGTTGASGGVATTGEARDRQASGKAGEHREPWMSATGAAFDRGFIDAQVKAHQEAIALFEAQANGGSDSDLKAFAQKQLPGLRNHLKQAQDLQAKLGSTD